MINLHPRYYDTKLKRVDTLASVARNSTGCTLIGRAPPDNTLVVVPSIREIKALRKRSTPTSKPQVLNQVLNVMTATAKELKSHLARWGLNTEGTRNELAVRYWLHDLGSSLDRNFSAKRWQERGTNLLFKLSISDVRELLEVKGLPSKGKTKVELVNRVLNAENAEKKSAPSVSRSGGKDGNATKQAPCIARKEPGTSRKPLKRKRDDDTPCGLDNGRKTSLDNEAEITTDNEGSIAKRQKLRYSSKSDARSLPPRQSCKKLLSSTKPLNGIPDRPAIPAPDNEETPKLQETRPTRTRKPVPASGLPKIEKRPHTSRSANEGMTSASMAPPPIPAVASNKALPPSSSLKRKRDDSSTTISTDSDSSKSKRIKRHEILCSTREERIASLQPARKSSHKSQPLTQS